MCGGRESNLGPQLLQASTLHATTSAHKKLLDKRCFGQIFKLNGNEAMGKVDKTLRNAIKRVATYSLFKAIVTQVAQSKRFGLRNSLFEYGPS